jgi:PQQ-dependent dehydrogenase (methanol/ethanol family)
MFAARTWLVFVYGAAALLATACGGGSSSGDAEEVVATDAQVTQVDGARILAANTEPGNWMSHGRTYDEQRFSPLEEINDGNVQDLGLAWYFDVPTHRGMEATPIVVDGRMYVTGSWSIVYALDASTGEELWRYDPQVPKHWIRYVCCDAVNRGVAVWGDRVFVGTLDGYLVAIDAATGEERWRVDTIDRKPPYSITGAPRIVNGLVIIGNGGAEFAGVRGYVSAYKVETGELAWRFYTVPGNPADGFENKALEKAAETWTGEWWTMGGGGTVWDSMAYDAELDLLYIGVGNGSPWNRQIRSPQGGDNLYLSSIIALRPDTGEYVWHYQTTPGDTWDFTATQHMILADLEVGDATRKVLMQAPKNGFFYVLDRTSGELISADPFVKVNWATGIDEQGRPVEAPNARYTEGPFMIMPSVLGGHNWHPMAYSPETQLVYLPAQDIPFVHGTDENFEFVVGEGGTGTDFELAAAPDDPAVAQQIARMISGQLVAWDPVGQRPVWEYKHAGPWNGGVLATAGNLVFQGSLIGEFAAYDAGTGSRLWQFSAQTGIAAAPVSYSVDDAQHVAVAAGWGTFFALAGGEMTASLGMKNISRILAFRLGGEASLPVAEVTPRPPVPEPVAEPASDELVAAGKNVYYERCWHCHGDGAASGGITPDLRYSNAETHANWDAIVLGGLKQANGMPAFGNILSPDDSAAVRNYVLERAQRAWERQQAQ